jgi:hypothetical protein
VLLLRSPAVQHQRRKPAPASRHHKNEAMTDCLFESLEKIGAGAPSESSAVKIHWPILAGVWQAKFLVLIQKQISGLGGPLSPYFLPITVPRPVDDSSSPSFFSSSRRQQLLGRVHHNQRCSSVRVCGLNHAKVSILSADTRNSVMAR